jgi:hypothetical protein
MPESVKPNNSEAIGTCSFASEELAKNKPCKINDLIQMAENHAFCMEENSEGSVFRIEHKIIGRVSTKPS